jgi:hypothetical protein
MKTERLVFITLVLVVLGSIITVNAASVNAPAVDQPWKVDFMGEVDGIRNLSTAFVGANQIPMLSYSKVGSYYISMAYKAPPAISGNCGPNDTWYCSVYSSETDLIPGTLSNMATLPILDTHLFGWAYSTGTVIRGKMTEFTNDMTYVTTSSQDLIQLSKFGGTLVGPPSLQIEGGHYRMAVTIRSGGDFPTYKLVYMYYIGNIFNSSCKDGGYAYQCDVIEEAIGYDSIGVPSLRVAPDATVGIAYYKYGGGTTDGVKYAYPHTDSLIKHSNCGPGDPKTWRCISVFAGTVTGTLSDVVKFAFGSTSSDRGIVFTYDDEMIEDTLYHAEYVGSGGNCGKDGTLVNPNIYAWKCSDVAILGDLASYYTPSYSIAVDPEGYSVIAFDWAMSDFSPFQLYIAYPNARIGNANPGWTAQTIDWTSETTIATGALASLSLNSAGLGFIGYLQEEDYELPDLKIALQYFETYLPLILR